MKATLLALMAGLAPVGAGCTDGNDAVPLDASVGLQASATRAGASSVPECDAYVARYEACLAHIAEPERTAAREALKAQRESFDFLSGSPDGKVTLKTTCRKLLDGLARNPACK